MAVLQVQNLKKTFGERVLFDNVSFSVYENDRIGFIGSNGCGKTTLLSILNGKMDFDAGTVSVSKATKLGVLEQSLPENGNTLFDVVVSVFEDLIEVEKKLSSISNKIECGEENIDKLVESQSRLQTFYQDNGGLTFRSRTRSTLLGLGFTEKDLSSSVSRFSGGELRKALLARLLLSKADCLLLDEPTNHLDLYSIAWLENFLISYRGSYIVISHDRFFLDKVTNKTMELKNAALTMKNGNYSRFRELMNDSYENMQREYNKRIREIKRLEGVIEQQRRWNQAHNYVTIASKEKQIERIRSEIVVPPKEEAHIRFHFDAPEPSGNEIIRADDITKSFGEKTLFSKCSFLVKKGEHVCLIGANGCGKTTLLKVFLGLETLDSGSCTIGANVDLGYYDQTQSFCDPTKSVFDEIYDSFPKMGPKTIRNALGSFLFRGDEINKNVGALSGGELARLSLLKLMLEKKNVLLLDEPTNHLDIASSEEMEKALLDFDGTLFIVSHDRYLINRIADRIMILDRNGVHDFYGDWDEYLKSLETDKDQAVQKNIENMEKDSSGNLYLQEKKRRSDLLRLKSEMKRVEENITSGEQKVAELEGRFLLPDVVSDYIETARLSQEISILKEKIDELYIRMEELDAEITGCSKEI